MQELYGLFFQHACGKTSAAIGNQQVKDEVCSLARLLKIEWLGHGTVDPPLSGPLRTKSLKCQPGYI